VRDTGAHTLQIQIMVHCKTAGIIKVKQKFYGIKTKNLQTGSV